MSADKPGAKGIFVVVGLCLGLAAMRTMGATAVYVNPSWESGWLYRYDHTGVSLATTASYNEASQPCPIGLACDPELGRVARTTEYTGIVTFFNLAGSGTFTRLGSLNLASAGAGNLSGISADIGTGRMYVADRNSYNKKVYCLKWNMAEGAYELDLSASSPQISTAWSLFDGAVDELRGCIYLTDQSQRIRRYRLADWSHDKRTDRIRVSGYPTAIAVDPVRGYIYYGSAGYGGVPDSYLVQYDLHAVDPEQTEKKVSVGEDFRVAGIAVDHVTGLIYATTCRFLTGVQKDVLIFEPDNLTKVGPDPAVQLPAPTGIAVANAKRRTMTLAITEDAPAGGVVPDDQFIYTITLDPNGASDPTCSCVSGCRGKWILLTTAMRHGTHRGRAGNGTSGMYPAALYPGRLLFG